MAQSEEFRRLLTEGIYRVSACEAGKPIRVVQDELGYTLGKRGGGSALEYWRQGHLPKTSDTAKLARELIRRSDLDQTWLTQFLASAAYPHPESLGQELFPNAPVAAQPPADPSELTVRWGTQLLPNKAYRTLAGRAALLAEALTALQDAQGRWIIAIDGIGGIGKTALARELVAVCEQKRLFDTVIWLSATGYAPWATPATHHTLTFVTLLDAVARALGAPDLAQAEPTEKLLRVQLLLRRQRVLIVLDNLETTSEPQAALMAELQALLNPSKALCTSRHRFTDDVYAIHLGGLTTEATAQFIHQEAQERRVHRLATVDETMLAQIVTTTGGSPLAIKLVVGQASYLPLTVMLQTISAARLLPSLLHSETDFYQTFFGPTWGLLSAPARELLVGLTLFGPGEGGELAAIHAVSGLPEAVLIQGINELWQLSLLEVAESGANADPESSPEQINTKKINTEQMRYFLHPLTYHFVVGTIRQVGPPSPLSAVDADYIAYLHGCLERALHYLLAEIDRYGAVPPPELERRWAMHLLDEALRLPALWPMTSQVLRQLAPKMEQAGHRHDWLPYLAQAIEQSGQMADDSTTAELQFQMAMLYQLLGDYSTAATQFATSAAGFGALVDQYNQARAFNRWAYVARLQQDHAQAINLAHAALALLAQTDAERGSSHAVLGAVALDQRDWLRAVDHFRQALAFWQLTGNQPMIARRLRDLGAALRQGGHYTEAIACYEQALILFAAGQEPSQQAVTQMNLGNVYLQLSQPEQALRLYELAEPIFQKTYDEPQLIILTRNIEEAHARLQQREKAEGLNLEMRRVRD